MFCEQLSLLPASFKDFSPCPPATNREAWTAIPAVLRTAIMQRGENALSFSFTVYSATDYLDFYRTGNRTRFESHYFTQRRMLNDLVLAECCEDNGRFLDAIINGIFAICSETAWQLPAHNSYIRDTPQLPLPDATNPIIDLFAAETGALLSVLYHVLGERLDAVSPAITANMLHQIKARIITPYLNSHFWWMGHKQEPMCNWTSWCTQNVLLCAFCTPQTAATRLTVVKQAAYSLDCFLKDYGEDGCCEEGAQYYHHAGLTLFGAMEILSAVAPQTFLPLYSCQKIYNIAAYIVNMHVADKYYVNFADCSPFAGRRGVREFLFGVRTQNTAMQQLAAADFKTVFSEPHIDTDIDRINLYYLVMEAFAAHQLLSFNTAAQTVTPDIFYPSVGVFVARDDTWCLAAKAGNNGDSHNHNDTGSVTLYKNKKPFLIDVGVESYSQKTFSPQRYEIWTMQSAWHNLPTFSGIMQQDGKAFGACHVAATLDNNESSLTMDIAGAYPLSAKVGRYVRTVTLQKGKGVTIADTTDYSGTVALSLMTVEKPFVTQNKIHIGSLGIIDCSAPAITVEEVPVTDPRLRLAWPNMLYRTTVRFEKELCLRIQ
ncbi:MAG: heparinase II/III family protein [Oscillospiraceae bacterium]|nr:heparinase II/III family protein [Oscillospiraceae bacterium]